MSVRLTINGYCDLADVVVVVDVDGVNGRLVGVASVINR